MTIDLASQDYWNYPDAANITITPANRARTLNSSAPAESLEVIARRLNSGAPGLLAAPPLRGSGSGMTQAQLTAYLDGIGTKAEATCEQTEGAVHTYKEVVGTYTLTGSGWSLSLPELAHYNEYGNAYSYYVVETPVTGYDPTYSGQESGLKDGFTDLEITNTQKVKSLSVDKVWALADPSRVTLAEGTTWPEGVTVHVTVYAATGGGTPAATSYSVDLSAEQPSYTFTSLPAYSGSDEVTYSVVETGVSGVDSSIFDTMVTGSEAAGYTITNTEKPRTKDFGFTKLWRDALGTHRLTWPAGESITVLIRQGSEEYATYTISSTDLTVGTEITAVGDTENLKAKLVVTAADAASGYSFGMTGLPFGPAPDGYDYSVSESTVEGYQPAKYLNAVGTPVPGATQVGDGGTVCNDQIGYVLPSTGGSGTQGSALFGGTLIALSGAALLLLRRKRRQDA